MTQEDENRIEQEDESRAEAERRRLSLREHAILLVVVLAIALIGNYVGPDIPILDAIPGMLVLYVISMIGLAITKYAPFYLPSIAWISLVAILVTLPWLPGSGWVVDRVENVDFLALATPVLAYAGLALTRRDVQIFKRSGWKLVIVAVAVFFGTYISSAAIAHVVMTLTGQI